MDRIALLVGEPHKGETSRAIQACNDYLRMGPRRSLRDLWGVYCDHDLNGAPTRSRSTLFNWSSKYGWTARAETYDAQLEEQKTALAQEMLASGLALAHERVDKLKWLAEFLEGQIRETDDEGRRVRVWLADAKQIGAGEGAERVEIERYNSNLINDYRAVLDDLAKEVGDRKQQHHVEGTGDDGAILIRMDI